MTIVKMNLEDIILNILKTNILHSKNILTKLNINRSRISVS